MDAIKVDGNGHSARCSTWQENDELFRSELEHGRLWQQRAAEFLQDHGIHTVIHEAAFRDQYDDEGPYANGCDMRARGVRIEVKSRRQRYISAASFPFPTIFVATERKMKIYERKGVMPDLFLYASVPTGYWVGLAGVLASECSETFSGFDKVRGIEEVWRTVPRSALLDQQEIIGWILASPRYR